MGETRTQTRTGLAGYLGGVLEAVEELVVDTRECMEGVIEHTGAVQRSAVRTVKRALRAENRTSGDDLALLRAELATLTARLSRFEAAPPPTAGAPAGASGGAPAAASTGPA